MLDTLDYAFSHILMYHSQIHLEYQGIYDF
jgi:hypothetical protein